ncbi:MAG: hypothetical protein A2Z20_02105 [Bdellovibrionales bacterium RBG_16_40_8]|nr:MAG: hypothetical protein A2Z20_02105 [Bdellovibrionales bacterium RBG_16_40_8]
MWLSLLTVFKRRLMLRTALAYLILIFSVSCSNALSNFANKTDDEALYYTALDGIRSADYASAIAACTSMSTSFSGEARSTNLCAAAYAGSCGYSLLTMISDLDTYFTTPPPEKLFHWYLTQNLGATQTRINDCDTAEAKIRSLGPASTRTADQNSFMVMLSIYKIGLVTTDAGDTGNDQILDVGFDACTSISDAQAQSIGSAFWELDKSLTALSANLYYSTLAGVVGALCTALNGIGKDLCNATDQTNLSPVELDGARSLIKEGAVVGVDQTGCSGGTVATCNCP